MLVNNFSWRIGGAAGLGIKSVGALFAKAMLRLGLSVFAYDEYPSLIRGGHNVFEVSASSEKVFAPRRPVNILVALDQTTFDLHYRDLAADAAVVFDQAKVTIAPGQLPKSVVVCQVPFETIVKAAGGEKIMSNTVALGASFGLLDLPFDVIKQLITDNFQGKKPEIINENVDLADKGYQFVKENYASKFNYKVQKLDNPGQLLMTGNEALAWGAIKSGCKLFAAYPMTPATTILHTMAEQAVNYNIVVRHAEDEISAINTAAGAGYAGVRAMTATAGGGFALMVETLGMGAMIEIPFVVVEAMRPGPSTGMPTWTGQADLKFVLNASQDEFPRLVLAPGDVVQCFDLTQRAFNLAEKYQLPVVIMTDKYLAEAYQGLEPQELKTVKIARGEILDEKELVTMKDYKRYLATASGISPRSLPGQQAGEYIANSDEHNEHGFSDESSIERVKMMDKRWRKMQSAATAMPEPILEGERHAAVTLVSWGSTRGPILEAIRELKKQNLSVNFLQIVSLSPFPVKAVSEILKKASKIAIVENNMTGQLAGWLREQTGLSPHYKILKYDGRPFFTEELVETIRNLK